MNPKNILCLALVLSALLTGYAGADTNKTAEAAKVRYIDLKMEIPGGFGPVVMTEQPPVFLVQLPIGGGSSFVKRPPTDVSSLDLQVWLLRKDGTSIPQHDKPNSGTIGNAGCDTDYIFYSFDRVPLSELAGLVVSVKGKLYSQEINSEK